MIGRHSSARLGALALLAVFAGTGACKGTGTDAVVYECRDPAALGSGEPLAKWLEVEGSDADPWVSSLAGRPGEVTAGDVVHVGGLALVLDGPAHHRFFVDDQGGRVSLSVDGGPTRLVGLTVTDPAMLAALSAEERQGLRGVSLATWSDALTAELRRLPLEHVVVSYDRSAAMMSTRSFEELPAVPPVPDTVRYLDLELGGPPTGLRPMPSDPLVHPEQGLPSLARLTKLRYLVVRSALGSSNPRAVDLHWLRGLGGLEHLTLETFGRRVSGSETLGALTALRSLDVSGTEGIELATLASLPALRWLDLRGTDVSSLAPLAGHPSLEVIDARSSGLTELPSEPMPALRDISVMGTRLEPRAAASFAALVPRARVAYRRSQALADSTACADRIRVRSGGLCHRDHASEETLLEVRDPAQVQAFVPLLTVHEGENRGTCMCCGEPTIELYRGERLVAEIGFHHGQSLRWRGWTGDGWMTDAGADALCKWLGERGVEACAERHQTSSRESSQRAR